MNLSVRRGAARPHLPLLPQAHPVVEREGDEAWHSLHAACVRRTTDGLLGCFKEHSSSLLLLHLCMLALLLN